jgi:hypothetical protein
MAGEVIVQAKQIVAEDVTAVKMGATYTPEGILSYVSIFPVGPDGKALSGKPMKVADGHIRQGMKAVFDKAAAPIIAQHKADVETAKTDHAAAVTAAEEAHATAVAEAQAAYDAAVAEADAAGVEPTDPDYPVLAEPELVRPSLELPELVLPEKGDPDAAWAELQTEIEENGATAAQVVDALKSHPWGVEMLRKACGG